MCTALLGVLLLGSCSSTTNKQLDAEDKQDSTSLHNLIVGVWEHYQSDNNPVFQANDILESYAFDRDGNMTAMVGTYGSNMQQGYRYLVVTGDSARQYTEGRTVWGYADTDTILLVQYPKGESLGEITAKISKISENEFTMVLLNAIEDEDSLYIVDHYRRKVSK